MCGGGVTSTTVLVCTAEEKSERSWLSPPLCGFQGPSSGWVVKAFTHRATLPAFSGFLRHTSYTVPKSLSYCSIGNNSVGILSRHKSSSWWDPEAFPTLRDPTCRLKEVRILELAWVLEEFYKNSLSIVFKMGKKKQSQKDSLVSTQAGHLEFNSQNLCGGGRKDLTLRSC